MNLVNAYNPSNINSYNSYAQFDKKFASRYNNTVHFSGTDKFVKKGANALMDEELYKVFENKYKGISDSPVAFVKQLIKSYSEGKITDFDFANQFLIKNKNAKINMSVLSKNERDKIINNYRSELEFADKLNGKISEYVSKTPEINNILKEII